MSWDRRHRARTNQSTRRLGLLQRMVGAVGRHTYAIARETVHELGGAVGGALASGTAVTMAERSGHDVPTAVTVGVVALGTAVGQKIAQSASSTVDTKIGMGGDTSALIALVAQARAWARETGESMVASSSHFENAETLLRQVAGRAPRAAVLESLQELAEARQLLAEAKVLSDSACTDLDAALVHYMSG